jgi:hypothetical protein
VCLGDHPQGGGAAWHRGVVGGCKSLMTIRLHLEDGVAKGSGGAISGGSAIAQLRGYAREIWTPNLHVAFGWLLILPGASDVVPSLCLVNFLVALVV